MQKISRIGSAYVAKTYLIWLFGQLLVIGGIIYLIDLIENLRRFGSMPNVDGEMVALLTGMRLPYFFQQVFPLIILFSTMGSLWWRTRSHELTVMRATGSSIWQILTPVVLIGFCVSMVAIAIVNPSAVHLMQSFEKQAERLEGAKSLVTVSSGRASQIWVHEYLDDGRRLIIRGRSVQFGESSNLSEQEAATAPKSLVDLELYWLTKDVPDISWSAGSGLLAGGALQLYDVEDITDRENPVPIDDQRIQTKVKSKNFEQDETGPDLTGFWALRERVYDPPVDRASSLEERMWLMKMMAQPILMVGMILLGAVFSLRTPRKGQVGILISLGAICAISLHFFSDLMFALGLSGQIPSWLAVLGPIAMVCFFSTFLLISSEEG